MKTIRVKGTVGPFEAKADTLVDRHPWFGPLRQAGVEMSRGSNLPRGAAAHQDMAVAVARRAD